MKADLVRSSWSLIAADAVVAAADRARVLALRLQGARSLRISTASGSVHVLDVPGRGSMPPVVLLHGLSASAADYDPLVRRLRRWSERIVAPDLPGHGLSPSTFEGTPSTVVEALIDALDRVVDRPAIVFGNSLGGLVAIRYALARSSRVAGLCLVSPAGAWTDAMELRALLDLLRVDDLQAATAFLRRVLPGARWPLGMIAWAARARLSRPGVRRLLADTRPSDLLSPVELSRLSMPLMLVWGAQEQLLPPSHLAFFRRHLPGHTRHEAPASFGHAPFLDRPDQVAHLLEDFATEIVTDRWRSRLRPVEAARASA